MLMFPKYSTFLIDSDINLAVTVHHQPLYHTTHSSTSVTATFGVGAQRKEGGKEGKVVVRSPRQAMAAAAKDTREGRKDAIGTPRTAQNGGRGRDEERGP